MGQYCDQNNDKLGSQVAIKNYFWSWGFTLNGRSLYKKFHTIYSVLFKKSESDNLLNYKPLDQLTIPLVFWCFSFYLYILHDLTKFCEHRFTSCTWAIYQKAKSLHHLFIPTFYKKLLAGY